MGFRRSDSDFLSQGLRCAAWLYLPDASSSTKPPVVVMAHGFAGERSWALPRYAEHFAERGLAVLLFDYRCFGDSEGEPRNFVHPKRHCQDWKAAVAHVRTLEEVDASRIALWGTSFSGGHVLVTAAGDPAIKAVVAQVPFVDALASGADANPREALPIFGAAFKDLFRSWLGKSAHTIGIVGPPGSLAYLSFPGWEEAYRAIIPNDGEWPNMAPARGLFGIAGYRPIKSAPDIQCPVLLVYAEHDAGTPASAVEATAGAIAKATLLKFDCDHFGVYDGEYFEKALAAESEFLSGRLLGNEPDHR